MLKYDNLLRSSARDTKLKTITCNYLYKELQETYSREYFDCCRLQSLQFVHILKINAYIMIARVQRDLKAVVFACLIFEYGFFSEEVGDGVGLWRVTSNFSR